MRFALPISAQSTTPLREAIVFAGLTIALTWLFWIPGSFLPGVLGGLFLAIGSFVPLAVAIFLDIWLQKSSFKPYNWFKTITSRGVAVALLLPIFILIPSLLLRFNQITLDVGKLFSDARTMWFSLVVLFVLALAEEAGWRGYLLPRLKLVPTYITNLIVGFLWFFWQLPIIIAGRYNESENFPGFFFAMLLYALLITPFLNRLARNANFNPIPSAILRATLQFSVAVYFLQGRADPLTDTFGNLTIAWLIILNAILFSQLWLNKKPPADITELERIMPLEAGS
jgi:membrane protease YdiL (CAAX protease family)